MNFSIKYSALPPIILGISQSGDHETVKSMVKELCVEIENMQIEIQNLKNTVGSRREVISVGCSGIKETALAAIRKSGSDISFENLDIEEQDNEDSENLYTIFDWKDTGKFHVVVKEVPDGWYCDYVKEINSSTDSEVS
jgi:hypothetical protein